MKKSLSWLKQQAKKYDQLSEAKKHSFLNEAYYNYSMSWASIAKLVNTYVEKIKRDAKKFGISSRTKSQAQSLALKQERHIHPTKGKQRPQKDKIKISESVHSSWKNMDVKEKKRRKDRSKELWNEKTPQEIIEFRRAAGDAVRKAAKTGSALEKHLFKELLLQGFKVEFHKKYFILREEQEIDLFIPLLNVAIEVDGPSHFANIWGADVLQKNIDRDRVKTGLLLERGLCIIRVQQRKPLSGKYKRDLTQAVLDELEKIKNKFPPKGERHKILGDV